MTILDFQRFKELMLVFKNKVEYVPVVGDSIKDWAKYIEAIKVDINVMLLSRTQHWELKSQYPDNGAKV